MAGRAVRRRQGRIQESGTGVVSVVDERGGGILDKRRAQAWSCRVGRSTVHYRCLPPFAPKRSAPCFLASQPLAAPPSVQVPPYLREGGSGLRGRLGSGP